MPTYEITAPDGRKFRVTGPEGGTREQALAKVQAQYAAQSAQQQKPAVDPPTQEGGLMQFGRDLGRAAVSTARDYAQGALGIAALPVDAIYGLSNFLTGRNDMNASQALDLTLNQAGVPQTENPYIRRINQAVGGSVTGISAGRALQSPVGDVLAASPRAQVAGSVTGATSSQLAADMGAGPVGQTVAGVLGGAAGSSVRPISTETVRRSFRGGEAGRQQVAQNIDTFQRTTGRAPTVGQATQNRRMQSAESLLSRTPGGAGVMARNAEQLSDAVATGLDEQAARLAANSTPEQAGRIIAKSITGEGGFIDQFKSRQTALYSQLDNYIPKDAQVSVSRTRQALAALNQEIPNAPELSRFFKNAKIQGIEGALEADTAIPPGQMVIPPRPSVVTTRGALGEQRQKDVMIPEQRIPIPGGDRGWMPYESVQKLRTLVGNEMADAGILSDVPRSKWKALYAALSADMEGAARQAGPEALNKWKRANAFTRAGMARLDAISHVIDKAGGPERVFTAALSGTRDGATTLRGVMQSLPIDGQRTLSAAVIRRLGRATPGAQNAAGEAFSTETFLTNWNRLSPEAKRTLFDRYGPGFRQDMDRVAALADNLRQGSQVFRNPSGTAQAGVQYTTVGGFAFAVASGNLGAASAIAAGVGGANLSARLLTNPKFVKWLAVQSNKPIAALPSALNQLAQSSDPDLQEAAALMLEQQRQQ